MTIECAGLVHDAREAEPQRRISFFPSLCLLADGSILAGFQASPAKNAATSTIRLARSHDGGGTWPEAARLVVHVHDERAAISQRGEEIDFAEYWEDMGRWSFGHPVLRLLPDGRLLAAWYAGTPHCMSIHWARIRL